jgi:hypothetical protein
VDNTEARAILHTHLDEWRRRTYAELANDVGQLRQFEAVGRSGAQYQVNVEIRWDDKPNGAIRVLVDIDDGGWRAVFPLSDDFIVGPDGRFVGE